MKQSKNTSYYVKSAIVVAIMVIFQFLPPVGQITELGMKVLGIYIALLYGWSAVNIVWPSFLALFFLAFSGYDTGRPPDHRRLRATPPMSTSS